MIKLIKRIIKKMIEIGNSIISSLCIGSSTSVARIDVQDKKVWPETVVDSISFSPTALNILYGDSSSGTIAVTSSGNWSFGSSATPASGWYSASKTNNTTISWSVNANDSSSNRVLYLNGTMGTASAQTVITQRPGYYIYIEGYDTGAVPEGGGTMGASVISRHGYDAVPVTCTLSYSSGSAWATIDSSTDAGNGKYTFRFNIDRNTDTQSRILTATFTQTQGSYPYKSVSCSFTQNGMYVPATIQGFNRYTGTPAYVGDWQIGTYRVGTYSPTSSINDPLNSIAVANVNPICNIKSYTITIEGTFQSRTWNGSGYSVNQIPYSNTFVVSAGHTISLPNGDPDVTVYGYNIQTAIPNGIISNITKFEVTPL